LKAIAAIQREFPCVGLPGVSSCHAQLVQECRRLKVPQVVLLFDTEPDPTAVDAAAERLARELLAYRIPVCRGSLPLEPGEKKADLDSYLSRHTKAEFISVLREAGNHPIYPA
jgi:hypothetical protein